MEIYIVLLGYMASGVYSLTAPCFAPKQLTQKNVAKTTKGTWQNCWTSCAAGCNAIEYTAKTTECKTFILHSDLIPASEKLALPAGSEYFEKFRDCPDVCFKPPGTTKTVKGPTITFQSQIATLKDCQYVCIAEADCLSLFYLPSKKECVTFSNSISKDPTNTQPISGSDAGGSYHERDSTQSCNQEGFTTIPPTTIQQTPAPTQPPRPTAAPVIQTIGTLAPVTLPVGVTPSVVTLGPGQFIPVANANCLDFHPECLNWARANECNNNPIYMLIFCQQSCGTCQRLVNADSVLYLKSVGAGR